MNASPWHVGIAAEAFVAAQFARLGFDVSVQYGANQPGYDLIVSENDDMMRVSVKGSKDGSWGLTQSHLTRGKADYHAAASAWARRHAAGVVVCLVQFKGVNEDALPRVWLATVADVAERLKSTAKGRGDTILYERHAWGRNAYAAGTADELPPSWRFTVARARELLPWSATGGRS